MLPSRRSLILGTGAAIITRRALAYPIRFNNPLAFPGGNPGYNPKHLASGPLVRYSGVASGSNFINLLNGSPCSVVGSSLSGAITPQGPAVANAASASGYLTTPSTPETLTGCTFAAIYTPASTSGNAIIFSNNGTTQNSSTTFFGNLSGLAKISFGASANGSGIVLVAGTPYFIAGSLSLIAYNVVSLNLFTGQIQKDTGPLSAVSATTINSTYLLAGNNFSQSMAGDLSALMYSVGILNMPQQLEWVAAPWDFWYPPTTENLLVSSVSTPIAAPGVFNIFMAHH